MTEPSFTLPAGARGRGGREPLGCHPQSTPLPAALGQHLPVQPGRQPRVPRGDSPSLEPFSLIPALGAVTSRLRFVTFVLKLPVRDPVLTAEQAHLGRRAEPAAASSSAPGSAPGARDYEVLGVDWASRGLRMDESIAILRGLAAGGYFEYHGTVFDLPPVKIAPVPGRPIARPHRRSLRRRPPPRRPAGRRLATRRGRPSRPARPPGPPSPVPRRGGHRGPPVRRARDLGRRLHPRRRAPPRGPGRHRPDRRLPLALRTGPDTEPLDDKLAHLRRYADAILAKL